MPSLLFDDRDQVLAAIWHAYMEEDCERELAERHGLTFAKFAAHYDHAAVVGVVIRGAIAGGAIFDGNRMHLAIVRKYRANWFKALRPLLAWAFNRYGSPLKASANRHNAAAIKFIEHVGCVRQGENEHMIHFGIFKERMRYGRRC